MHTHELARMRTALLAVLVAAGVGLAPAAWAGAPTDSIRKQVDVVVKALEDPTLKERPAERRAVVKKAAEEIFDYPDTARRALGSHWSPRTPQEKEEFVRVFSDLLDRSYISKIDLYQGENVKYVGETVNGNEAIVKTAIQTKSGNEVPIEYRMHLKDSRWLVYDVIIEGVSLVSNYRTQFNKVVQTEGYDTLVQKLKERGAAPAASPGRR